ncbi:methyltransferase family protein [Rhodobacter aestuarii]|uniref:Methyltransferase domain-containing protein n=1 Tax=Rhodobacter aestuarii TaxID=453582 RepID=A0A1N7J5K3_9RHOB|nr:methyltransferase domain-containing protein [Rhodobacter aestuarii]PTV97166.1 methyltransferase family protein [Rhodobacter aestuarii]SIS44511.1 Methyltransferase domain-containing protein [Rhodobacter aestuarii]
MERRDIILKGISKTDLGIEVAPWLAAIAPRAAGYNIRILDVFDTETLRARGAADPNQSARDCTAIEEVDFVGSATEIAALVPETDHGRYDYIVSSHNFEHLPNPIKFLNGCAQVLRPGGVLSIAVPDHRGCFDVFRSRSTLADWIEASLSDPQKPSPAQVFRAQSVHARRQDTPSDPYAFQMGISPARLGCETDLRALYDDWKKGTALSEYIDTHCSVFTPASLELMLLDAQYLGLISLEVEEVSDTTGVEFYVRLRRPIAPRQLSPQEHIERRNTLLRRMVMEYSEKLPERKMPLLRKITRKLRALGRRLRGKTP